MRAVAFAAVLVLAILLAMVPLAGQAGPATQPQGHVHDDALVAPPPGLALLAGADDLRGPSQFMAGDVAVLVVLPESNGARDPSREDWTPAQVEAVRRQIQGAFDWWVARLPLARLSFQMRVQIVPTDYEPTSHGLATEGLWVGDTLQRLGFSGTSYFDQAYAAAEAVRDEFDADWGTVLFVPNSANGSGYLADGRFAYAYINGPFLVVTSDAGSYGTADLAEVVAHELGHTFGALDQYPAARIACDRRSGYLNSASSNSQFGGCGTRFPSIMLDAGGAFDAGQIDSSALHQIGYRDSDGDGLIDPLDTAPAVDLQPNTLASTTGRPVIRGSTRDVPFPSTLQNDVTLNRIAAVEFRVDGGPWIPIPALDGAYDSPREEFSVELPLYDGSYDVEVRATNSAGVSSPLAEHRFDVSWIGPAPYYGVGGPTVTATPAVSLQIQAPPTTEALQVSEDVSFSSAKWLPLSPTLTYDLGPGDGPRTVYVRFRDRFSLVSLPVAASFVLDTQPPRGSAMRPPADPTLLTLSAVDESSAVTEVEVTVQGEAPRWQPYAARLAVPEATSERAVTVRFRDAAGNTSQPAAAALGYRVALPLVRN